MFLAGAARATVETVKISLSSGGYLSYSLSLTDEGPCDDATGYYEMFEVGYSNTVYVDPSGNQFQLAFEPQTLTSVETLEGGDPVNCVGSEDGNPVSWYLDVSGNTPGSQLAAAQINFQPTSCQGSDCSTAEISNATTTGWINPKFIVKTVLYAPPGSASSVNYETDMTTGASQQVTNSFKVDVKNTVSGKGEIGVQFGVWGFSYGVKETISAGWSEEQQSSRSYAWSAKNSSALNYRASSPPCPQYGLDHDCDAIVVMLNPVATFAIFPDGTVGWTGMGYDLADQADYPDIDDQPVWLGCLNGNFYNAYQTLLQSESQQQALGNSGWGTCVSIFNQNFSRTWAANNVDGSGPALTPTLTQAQDANNYNFCGNQWYGTDLYNICWADPFANTAYTVTFPSGSLTTADGRFTACHDNPNCTTVFHYFPGESTNYSQGYSTTQTSSQTATDTYSVGYSVESGGFFGLIGSDMTNSVTWTWTHVFNTSTNSMQSQTGGFSIVGPASGYYGTDQFTVLQDNLFGTFMLNPGN